MGVGPDPIEIASRPSPEDRAEYPLGADARHCAPFAYAKTEGAFHDQPTMAAAEMLGCRANVP